MIKAPYQFIERDTHFFMTRQTSQRSGMIQRWILPLAVTIVFGMLTGLGFFTLGFGEGKAYLGNNPASCTNCHVMQDSYDSWQKSSHHAVTVCNDCHMPHDNLIAKYLTKAENGFFHSLAFTTGDFKDPIQIKKHNSQIVQASCLHCHTGMVNHMLPIDRGGDMLSCVHCHRTVGHAQTIAPRSYEGY